MWVFISCGFALPELEAQFLLQLCVSVHGIEAYERSHLVLLESNYEINKSKVIKIGIKGRDT